MAFLAKLSHRATVCGMSTLIKPARRLRPVRRKATSSPVLKAAPGNPFAGVEYVFGSMSFTPLKGKALKQHIRARILADHYT